MTFDEVNKTLGEKTGGADGYGCKLERNYQTGKVYMVSISSDDGGVRISEVEDTEENWAQIEATFELSEGDDDFGDEGRMEEAVDAHSTYVVSTSFWG